MAEMAESLTFGFLRLLEALSPVERVVFVLADVFGVPYAEIAEVVDRSPAACRQVASRARSRVREDHRPGTGAEGAARAGEAEEVADRLVEALLDGDADRVVALLAPDVVLVSDGGPDVHAARRPVVGQDRVGRLLVNLSRRMTELGVTYERRTVNGQAGAVALWGGTTLGVVAAAVDGARVSEIHVVVNPGKLAAVELTDPIE
jgi:RNA polymerase sigma-70 factor (ECF subfamily)